MLNCLRAALDALYEVLNCVLAFASWFWISGEFRSSRFSAAYLNSKKEPVESSKRFSSTWLRASELVTLIIMSCFCTVVSEFSRCFGVFIGLFPNYCSMYSILLARYESFFDVAWEIDLENWSPLCCLKDRFREESGLCPGWYGVCPGFVLTCKNGLVLPSCALVSMGLYV